MTTPEPTEPPPEVFERRRTAALAEMGDSVLVLPAAPIQRSSRDTERPYAPDRELYYLTGATEPGTLAVLVGGDEPRYVLFVPDRDPVTELWAGRRLSPDQAAERFAPDDCLPTTALDEALPGLLAAGRSIHFRVGRGGRVERAVLDAIGLARDRGPRAGTGPRAVIDPGEVLDDLRLIKGREEVERIRRSVAVTADGHRAGARAIGPGVGEWVVEAAIDGAFRAAGAGGIAFETIVGSGRNACVLHYVSNRSTIGPEDLVLVDAGAETGLYAGDLTRTWPASGRFTDAQRDVYDLVDAARRSAIEAARPGRTIADVHMAAARTLTEGLVALDVLEGAVTDLVESAAYRDFYPHQTSHWLGLDVHDPGDYARDGRSRELEPGMVFTVEPGLYFAPRDDEAPGPFDGIGVRIEDDVLVTESGCEVLSAGLPTAADEIVGLVGAGR